MLFVGSFVFVRSCVIFCGFLLLALLVLWGNIVLVLFSANLFCWFFLIFVEFVI